MKGEKGITLISLVIYLIAMVIIIAVVASISGYFYKNIDVKSETQDIHLQFSRFNSYFTEDVNKPSNRISEIGYINGSGTKTTNGTKPSDFVQHYILFSSGNQYTFIKQKVENNKVIYGAIYLNNIKIASNITNCVFEKVSGDNTSVKVQIEGNNFSKEITYKLK